MSDKSSTDWSETKTRPGRLWPVARGPVRHPGLTVLAHPDASRVGERAVFAGLKEGGELAISRLEPLFSPVDGSASRPLADTYISRRPVILKRRSGGVDLLCSDSGTRVVAGGCTIATQRRFRASEIERGIVLLLAESVALLLHQIEEVPSSPPHPTLVGESPEMVQLRDEIRRVADLDVPVLLRGETGTGKELVARAIHDAGPRREQPYLGVNMGAIPTTLAAAELFGAAKGAFTGADRRRQGYFQRANGGTLLLDEIGATPSEIQVMLLRVLETNLVEPVGDQQAQQVDVRILAATDTDLDEAIDRGEFRAPLLHRLSSYEISLPALRQRREDFGRLFFHFLRQELRAIDEEERLARPRSGARPWIPASLVARMADLKWPGNVRQLRNVARQLVIASRGCDEVRLTSKLEELLSEADESPEESTAGGSAVSAREPSQRQSYRDPQEVSEEELLDALRANRWRLKPTAVALGVSRTSLYALIDRSSQVRKGKDLSRQEVEKALERSGGRIEGMVDELEISRDALLRRMRELGLKS